MAASTNTAAGNGGDGQGGANDAAGDGVSVPENSVAGPTNAALRHNPGLCVDWTPEEQSLLEELLAKYASESSLVRYAKIAMQMSDKTVRDVALRCRWMTKKENGKRRKDDQNSSKKSKDKKEKVTDSVPKSAHVSNRTNGHPYAQSPMSMDNDDGISFEAIGGRAGQLLEQNARNLDQISSNVAAFKIQENIMLLSQVRNNILSILQDSLNDSPDVMKQMPPLPVKLNEELSNSILHIGTMPKTS